ncbi:Lipoprotein-releasing system transmembrane protein LolE [compost metagenome]
MAVFMVQGSVIGVIGTLIGTVLGVISALNVSTWIAALERISGRQIFSSDVYFVSYLPSELQLGDVLLICGAALVLSFLATIYPAWRAAQTHPAEALRYE